MEGVKTAGMVQGTPDWQLDLMYESELAQAWEDGQVKDKVQPLERFDFDALNESSSSLSVVLLDAKSMIKYLGQAIDAVPGTPEAHKLAAFSDMVSDLAYDIKQIQEAMLKLMFPNGRVSA